jgi:hypothetical protein
MTGRASAREVALVASLVPGISIRGLMRVLYSTHPDGQPFNRHGRVRHPYDPGGAAKLVATAERKGLVRVVCHPEGRKQGRRVSVFPRLTFLAAWPIT